MKKALFVLAAVTMGATAFGQGSIVFKNRNIPTTDPNATLPNGSANPNYIPGGNNNGSYNLPIYEVGGTASRNGAGDLPGGVTVQLLFNNQVIATTTLGTTTATAALFANPPSQDVIIQGATPGTSVPLTLRAFQGVSFAAAQAGAGQYGEWTFNSLPLGGAGSPPSTPPSLTGLGNQLDSFQGLELVPEPSTIALGALGIGALLLRRRK